MRDQHRRAEGRRYGKQLIDVMIFRTADAERIQPRLRKKALWITAAAMGRVEDEGHALRNRLQHFEVTVFAWGPRHYSPLPCLEIIASPMLPAACPPVHTANIGHRPCPATFTGYLPEYVCVSEPPVRGPTTFSNGSRTP